ncbi:hypothetical protein S7711_04354 [Stachybotrys chartarum IBT 7711]|uniref:Intradiol ring-cleavage dioxygenases domain-containing protein n=1 Tax=Stachybotrys chartarum (strain CBS 109288 / IBT 7711) TaxID=1280523 RepID=A0A084AY66_STACB|nr:hypothetical protein S7711_04354 [Stachybotrys chartarum IBT 7711]KFA55762.1 hypothetical protein S40293_01983 [Stachybotrys chartarum IBT 40293]KFA78005.1 hypothetical protein S40288_05258 [Stachybotrys chartarum IBT 40288]
MATTTNPQLDLTTNAHDRAFTEAVVAATGNNATPRMQQVMPALIRHLHSFAREVDLTMDELFAGVELINQCGQMSNDQRNETQLLCDVLGLEALVDAITTRQGQPSSQPKLTETSLPCTPSNILGPFYRHNAPELPLYSSIISPEKRDSYLPHTTFFNGRVLAPGGQPIANAVLDIWHTAPNGMYEQQDKDQADMDLRGRFATDKDGKFALYCLRPVAYPIPDDGPVGKLLKTLDRHPWRPAHIHFIVSAPGFQTLTTQLYDAQDEWLRNDSVFAAQRELVVSFNPQQADPAATWTAAYDFVLMHASVNDHTKD